MSGKRRITKKVLITLGCCCIIAAAALTLYNRWISAQAGAEADRLTASFADMLAAAAASPEEADVTGVDVGLEEHARTMQNSEGEAAATRLLDFITIDGYDVCGSIYIPAISIELAVISEWSYSNLKVSACRYSGTPDNQMIILAHNYDQHFGRIKELASGDEVQFLDVNGNVYTYEVYDTEIWGTYQLADILAGDDWDLTLFTCTYDGYSRVVVRCARIE